MSSHPRKNEGPGCPPTRREFITRAAAASAGLAAAGVLPWTGAPARAEGEAAKASSETLAAQFYSTLSDEQKKAVCFPFDHPLRSKVDNNWMITQMALEKFKPEQQALAKELFTSLHSPEYAKRVMEQVEHDSEDIGGFKACAIAFFGAPGAASAAEKDGKSRFEFVLTGRHVTRRCDGNSVEGAAFGGPIFYGHAAKSFRESPTHDGNAYWYQAQRANEVFKALDPKQRTLALRTDARREQGEKTVALAGAEAKLTGMPVSEMSADQKDLVRKVMADVLAPFRKDDAAEALKLVEAGGFDKLHLSFFSNLDVGKDGVWDVWQLEGPHMLWYFRGFPHVHTWVHIREPKKG